MGVDLMRTLQVSVLDRLTLQTKFSHRCAVWEIQRDYIENASSHFTLNGDFEVKKATFFWPSLRAESLRIGTPGGRLVPLYFGVVSSSENKQKRVGITQINASDILQLLDIEFPATHKSGNNVQNHLRSLIQLYLLQYLGSQLPPISVDVAGAGISHLYQPSDPPTATNLTEYAINIFKKYGVSWTVTGTT
ncbi:hypothetical protein MU448_11540 [Streptococcus sp. O1]|uniref:hypothetical protein n=1 Tax=Streptococcus sp. O1 TaxID=2928735 RepID=UPI00211B17A9|nr:hypothetical protein [Streptococcus sp. O1]MCQ9214976.1 hypothetical protein [Streptococcus sp. O1]